MVNDGKITRMRSRVVTYFRDRYEINAINLLVTLGSAIVTGLAYWFMVSGHVYIYIYNRSNTNTIMIECYEQCGITT
jgi:hypothetical protein